jgi:hypothetical protein
VTQMDVGFRVGSVQKVLRVHGDRTWNTLGPSPARSFVKMPLVYERAFGGVDLLSPHPERDWEWRNPVGAGFAVRGANLVGRPIPNIEYPDEPFGSWDDRPRPAGFGAIAGHWQPRVGFAGTYDTHWMKTRQPLLPDDFDDQFFQCSPVDQQVVGFLQGGERVALRGLSPRGNIDFALPRVDVALETRFFDGSSQQHDTRLHSVILEADFPRVTLVFHSALSCHCRVQKLDRTIATLKQSAVVSRAAGERVILAQS